LLQQNAAIFIALQQRDLLVASKCRHDWQIQDQAAQNGKTDGQQMGLRLLPKGTADASKTTVSRIAAHSRIMKITPPESDDDHLAVWIAPACGQPGAKAPTRHGFVAMSERLR
jgi:hypothetical protein